MDSLRATIETNSRGQKVLGDGSGLVYFRFEDPGWMDLVELLVTERRVLLTKYLPVCIQHPSRTSKALDQSDDPDLRDPDRRRMAIFAAHCVKNLLRVFKFSTTAVSIRAIPSPAIDHPLPYPVDTLTPAYHVLRENKARIDSGAFIRFHDGIPLSKGDPPKLLNIPNASVSKLASKCACTSTPVTPLPLN